MRCVLDTNVLVSGLITASGPCGQIVELMIDASLQPCVDSRILDEYEAVLHRPKLHIPSGDADEILELIRYNAQPVAPRPLRVELPDPDDIPFLEVAFHAGAPLVTGNMRHFPARQSKGVHIVTPREFLNIVSRINE